MGGASGEFAGAMFESARTAVFAAAVSNFVLALSMLFVWLLMQNNRDEGAVKGPFWWSAGFFIRSAMLFINHSLAGTHNWMTAVLGNSLEIVSYVFLVIGIQVFFRRRPPYLFMLAVGAIGIGAISYFFFHDPDFANRAIASALVSSFLLMVGAWYLLQVPFEVANSGRNFAGGLLALTALIRLFTNLPGQGGDQVVGYILIQALMFSAGIGFVIMIMQELIAQRQAAADELKRQASTDPMTGVYNRRRFMELAELEYARSRRFKRPLCVLIMDIDKFKTINDTYGHPAGDKAIIALAHTMVKELRTVDIFARFGGEEFVALMAETPIDAACQVGDRLRRRVKTLEITCEDGRTFRFTISIGVAGLIHEDLNIETMLSRADQALYMAKERGRDRVEVVAGSETQMQRFREKNSPDLPIPTQIEQTPPDFVMAPRRAAAEPTPAPDTRGMSASARFLAAVGEEPVGQPEGDGHPAHPRTTSHRQAVPDDAEPITPPWKGSRRQNPS